MGVVVEGIMYTVHGVSGAVESQVHSHRLSEVRAGFHTGFFEGGGNS